MRHDLDRIRFLSQNFSALQGLRGVPVGIALILDAWLFPYYSVSRGNPTAIGCGATLLVLGALIVLHRRIGTYYDRRFGRIEPRPGPWLRALGVLAGFLVFVAVSQVEMRVKPPLSVASLALAACFGAAWLKARPHGLRGYYAVIAAGFLCLSWLPLFVRPSPFDARAPVRYVAILETALGVALVVAGVLDHLELARDLKEVPADGSEIAV